MAVLFKTDTGDWTSTILQSQSLELVTINSDCNQMNVMIGGFSGEDLKWLAHVTVQLQMSDYSQLSNYTVRLQLYIY